MGKFKGMLCIVLATAMFFHAPPSMGSMAEPIQAEAASAVQLNKTKLIMDKGGTYQLKLSGFKKKVTWKSSNKRVATVSSSGKVTAKKAGKAVITAKAGKNSYRCSVTVENPKISKKNATVYVGKTITLKMNNTVRRQSGAPLTSRSQRLAAREW